MAAGRDRNPKHRSVLTLKDRWQLTVALTSQIAE
jgi:hypothetical protein